MIKRIQFGLMAVCIASIVGMIFTPQGRLGSAMAYVAIASFTGFYGLLLVPQRDEPDKDVDDSLLKLKQLEDRLTRFEALQKDIKTELEYLKEFYGEDNDKN